MHIGYPNNPKDLKKYFTTSLRDSANEDHEPVSVQLSDVRNIKTIQNVVISYTEMPKNLPVDEYRNWLPTWITTSLKVVTSYLFAHCSKDDKKYFFSEQILLE